MPMVRMHHNRSIAEFLDDTLIVRDEQDFLDIAAETGARTLVFRANHLHEDFFDLRTGVAGRILQKASNYRLSIGIVGDFGKVGSRNFRDFIRESNETGQVVFKPTLEEALAAFAPRGEGV